MRDSWLELVDIVLRPARPNRAECLRAREAHIASQRSAAEARARAIATCERRIEEERAAVFAANDGVISSRMTALEREWRKVARTDPERGLMDLWARIAPPAWHDRKRWRDSDPDAKLDAAIALAADVPGVEAAEAAIGSLRDALATWGTPMESRVRWRAFAEDADCVTVLLARSMQTARDALSTRDAGSGIAGIAGRAETEARAVEAAARVRFPERPLLARSLGRAALADGWIRGARIADRPNPVTHLRALWRTGYVLSSVDASGVTLEIPPL